MTTESVCDALVVAFGLSIFALPISAQSSYGSIVGTVTDATGATVPGAAVTVTNEGTSERCATESEASGSYQFVNLQPGSYRVDIEKRGFSTLGTPTLGGVRAQLNDPRLIQFGLRLTF